MRMVVVVMVVIIIGVVVGPPARLPLRKRVSGKV